MNPWGLGRRRPPIPYDGEDEDDEDEEDLQRSYKEIA